ncbi:phosphoglycolate phosphatase [Actibacterium sp. 188UL27-1]|uniref:phosphoglycolate phosphatase n=1 Tax=Actibacterium sp. 188UL27-1 TaxID=2786961 RepID=UPI00195DAA85|nr:phosphoglycolate phosphatase [Actibacterium sp. 188UL27-1]MBM7068252.1 phosphoglycolate phosphatase [Actibacterium sp. 188UL27-1]
MNIVFDLDGTLVDSAPDIRAAANGALADRGIAPLTMAEARGCVGHGAAVFMERARGLRGVGADLQTPLLEAFLARYEDAVDLTQPYPGVMAALAGFLERDVPMAVCTNKPIVPTRNVLAHLGLDRFFPVVVGGDTLPVRKPDPSPLLHVIDALGGGSILYVGDSEVDAETADRAGVPFALFTEGYRKAPVETLPHAHAFDHFDLLPGIVRQVAAGPAV